MARWYIARGGSTHGPLSDDELKDLARDSDLQPTDMVCREGTQRWCPASQVVGLFTSVTAIPPPPPPPPLPTPLPTALAPAQAEPPEREFLQEGDVKVTDKRLVVGSKTFLLSGLTSTDLTSKEVLRPASEVEGREAKKKGVTYILGGGGGAVFSFVLLCVGGRLGSGGLVVLALLLGLGSLIIAIIGGECLKEKQRERTVHIVLVCTAAGEVQALTTEDVEFAKRVLRALDQAIVART